MSDPFGMSGGDDWTLFDSEPSIVGGAMGGGGGGGRLRDRAKAKMAEVASSERVAKAANLAEKALERFARRLERSATDGSSGSDTASRVSGEVAKTRSLSVSGGSFNNFMGGFTGNPVLGPNGYQNASGGAAAFGTAAAGAMSIGGAVLGGIDSRIDTMYGRSLSYDKLSVLYQQTKNVTQQQFVNRFVQPLMQQRLGQGGAATLLGLQAQTGLNANLNASSVSAMQAATGYMYNTQDMARAMATLGSAQVNNRMTMTMGTGMYGPGGNQRSMMNVIQQVVKSSGLTNARMASSAMQQGSITRARLGALGLPEDMQNMVLQYAQENINFQQKGGKGMYDPSKAADRKLMGIEKNFSTQQQETERTKDQRDLSFYKKQTDNYAALEKRTQSLTRTMEALEKSMSGLIGARMRTKNNTGLNILKMVGGAALVAGGAALSATGIGAAGGFAVSGIGAGLFAGGAQGMMGGAVQSDPMPGSSPSGGGQRRVNSQMDSSRSFSKLNPQFRSRIAQMLEDNPNVYIGDGHRDSSKQRTLFLSRYSKTQEKTGIFWEGSYWKKNPGVPDATPPGMSMHEVGLAVDLGGDLKWVQTHASKYGLRTFANNGEPWHIQPADLPADRVAYEKAGARWGLNGAQPLDKRTFVAGMGSVGTGKGGKVTASGGVSGPSSVGVGNLEKGSGLYRKPNKISANSLVKLLYNAGFRGRDLEAMAGIATRETVGFNANALNPHGRDVSYGLYQINMKNDDPENLNMGTARLGMFKISKAEELYDPATNVKAAKVLFDSYKSQGKNPFTPWLGSNNVKILGKENAHGFDYKKGVNVLTQGNFQRSGGKGTHDWAPKGDPMPVHRMSMSDGGGNTFVGGANITIAPNITIAGGGGSGVDAHKVAQEAARIIERDLKVALLRKN